MSLIASGNGIIQGQMGGPNGNSACDVFVLGYIKDCVTGSEYQGTAQR
jgi:hypothetical protein